MNKIFFIVIAILSLGLLPINGNTEEIVRSTPAKLITAVDLLIQKNLSLFQPTCAVGGPTTGLITGEDLLRLKGLLGKLTPVTNVNDDQEEDIWGMGQDFGC